MSSVENVSISFASVAPTNGQIDYEPLERKECVGAMSDWRGEKVVFERLQAAESLLLKR